MACIVSEVAGICKKNQEALLRQLLPEGRYCFNAAYIADSPKNKHPDGALHYAKNGQWLDAHTGKRGSGIPSLYAYLRDISEAAALAILSKRLDPAGVYTPVSTVPDALHKRAQTPRQRADALLRHALLHSHDRQN